MLSSSYLSVQHPEGGGNRFLWGDSKNCETVWCHILADSDGTFPFTTLPTGLSSPAGFPPSI